MSDCNASTCKFAVAYPSALNALVSPRPYAGWLLIEEKAEGGDMLAHIARERPSFLDGYTRVCEAAGVALYRRQP